MRRFVLGDIHGQYEYLLEVLRKCGFDYEKDQLIQIGDIVDRGPEPFKCMDELLKIKNLILIKGNHDQSMITYIHDGFNPLGEGNANGTDITHHRWKELPEIKKQEYIKFVFNEMRSYYISDDNIMFTHGGFDRWAKLDDQNEFTFAWDRELIQAAMSCKGKDRLKTLYNFKEIFIGHTPTLYWGKVEPIFSGGVWNVDTGSGKGGPLTIMDIDTHEYWQSDYPEQIKEYVIIQKNKSASLQKVEETEEEGETERKAA